MSPRVEVFVPKESMAELEKTISEIAGASILGIRPVKEEFVMPQELLEYHLKVAEKINALTQVITTDDVELSIGIFNGYQQLFIDAFINPLWNDKEPKMVDITKMSENDLPFFANAVAQEFSRFTTSSPILRPHRDHFEVRWSHNIIWPRAADGAIEKYGLLDGVIKTTTSVAKNMGISVSALQNHLDKMLLVLKNHLGDTYEQKFPFLRSLDDFRTEGLYPNP